MVVTRQGNSCKIEGGNFGMRTKKGKIKGNRGRMEGKFVIWGGMEYNS